MISLSLKDPKIVSLIGIVALIGYATDVLLYPLSNELRLLNISCIGLTALTLIFHWINKPKIEVSLSLFAIILLINLVAAPFFQINEPDFSSFYIRNTLIFWVIMPLLGLTVHRIMFVLSAAIYLVQFGIIIWISQAPFLLNSAGTIFLVLIGYIYVILFLLRSLEDASEKTEHLINTLREKNSELVENREELRSLVKTKDKLFSLLAHDLQSPFMGISGLSEIIKEKAQEGNIDKVIDYSTMIKDTTSRTNTLFSNLLDWAASQTGELEMQKSMINLDTCLNEALDLLNEHQQKKEIKIQRDKTDTGIFADPNGLKTVLRNLLSNAIKFTPRKGKITVKASKIDSGTLVSISDSGIGIRQDQILKLFNSNIYISTEGTEDEKGTGLGLSLCKEMIDKHNGKIWVESTLGEGSTFYFSIPDPNAHH
jgi:signal transduction histidine kinase